MASITSNQASIIFAHHLMCITPLVMIRIKLKEHVASLIGLYMNDGAVSCVGNYFLLYLVTLPCQNPGYINLVCTNTQLHGILLWADIIRNGNIFFTKFKVKDG